MLTCQLHPHQAAIVPDQLANAVPKQEESITQQLQNTVERMQTFWEEERSRTKAEEEGSIFFDKIK